jgi:hypothetical protein
LSWPGKSAKRVTLMCPGHPRLVVRADHKGVDAQDKPGHTKHNKKAPAQTGAFDIAKLETDQRE